MKPNKYILILLATLTAYVLFEYYRPKPLDWTSTYKNNDKIPFGTQALFELLPGVMQLPDVKTVAVKTVAVKTVAVKTVAVKTVAVKTVRLPIYNFLTETKPAPFSNYVFVSREFSADRNDLKQLFPFVRRGNNVFISAYDLPDSLGRVLGFKATVKDPTLADSTLLQNFVNLQLRKPGGYNFFHDDGRNFLQLKKPKLITVLGRNARGEPIFIRVQYGKGQFFIHNLPLAFTNYYVLDAKTSDYAFKALSYLPVRPTYWDEYQKQGRFDADEQSIFRYIRAQPALNWAYYLVVIGLIFYAIFAGKRTQRIIPVVEPPQNTSLEFVKSVGRLYFQQNDHDTIARKKIQYFLSDLRDRYGLNTTNLDKEFTDTLARKSGISVDEAQELVLLIRSAQRSISLSELDLLAIHKRIETFRTGVKQI